jgi:phosphonate transport system substrate-binding protein
VAALSAATVRAQGAPGVFRVTAIPDESPTELARKAAPLVKYLEQRLGTKVEYTPVTDYAAAVEAIANQQVDLAWFGGFTFVQALQRSGGKVIPLVQREEDEKFRSVFIATSDAIKSLADLKGRTFTFGSQSSTSGHLMPRSFLLAALNISVWDKLVADKKVDPSKVRVFFTTPPYYDYNWTVHADMPAARRERLAKAFLDLDKSTPEGREVLELQRATRFVPTKAENYKGIEAAARNAGLLK